MLSRFIAQLVLSLPLVSEQVSTAWGFSTTSPMLSSRASVVLPVAGRMKHTRSPSLHLHDVTQPSPTPETDSTETKDDKQEHMLNRAFNLYVGYFNRLWKETEPTVRQQIATDNAMYTLKRVQHIMRGEEYVNLRRDKDTLEDIEERREARIQILRACDTLLKDDASDDEKEVVPDKQIADVQDGSVPGKKPKKKNSRSVLFGATMGAVVALWVFSGNYIFTGLFTLMTILGQLEYYRMVMNARIYPARRISILGACSMFLSALFAPNLHQICLPSFAMISMIWFLTMRRQVSTISDIATTFTGMFYLGYIPSFWVRIRTLGSYEPTRLAPITKPILDFLGTRAKSVLPAYLPKTVHLPITGGAIFIFWSWLCIAFSDVGAYFAGRKYGKTKLGKIAPAAGLTSPNKTVEGFIGGCLLSAVLATIGAWVQKWPYWYLLGPLHGMVLGFLGLVGDLTASMLKRDAGLKDFGDLIPEHGGIMDRVDSFIFTAPYGWIMCQYIIPAIKKFQSARTVVPII